MSYALVDADLERDLVDPQTRTRYLVLDSHPDFPGHWIVESFSNEFFYDFGEIIGSYRALAPAGLERFLEIAEEHKYKVAFFEDPTTVLDQFEHLNRVPEVKINSTFDNTSQGMLSFQVQGFNLLKDLDYGVARWDTGTGKTVLASALAQWHLQRKQFDICFFVVKKNNKINTVRKLKKLAGLDAIYIRGPKRKREQYYEELRKTEHAIVVLNYEQFKHDFTERDEKEALQLSNWGEAFFPGRDVMLVWDEMPTKLSSRTSELYKAICKCLYRTAPPQVNYAQLRPKSMRAYMLSATPIENSPEGWFNCLRLLDGGRVYGTVSQFNNAYVKTWNTYDPTKPETFHNFEKMRLRAAHCIHQASKSDPEIAKLFPEAIEEPVYIDWDERNAAVYNEVQDLVAAAAMDVEAKNVPIFSLIGVLQMICDAPEMVNDSAARREVYEDALAAWEESPEGREPRADGSEFAFELPQKLRDRLSNDKHPKLEKLRELLLERHPKDQAVIYTKFNQTLMPYLEATLTEWGVSYGRYDGTDRQQQAVQDAFQEGAIRVFLSSDRGSDSIDLEAGSVVIDYNLPWKWTTVTQRHNRVHRPTSTHDTVYYYTLLMEGSVEERVLEIIEKKRDYHKQLFDPAAGDISASARMTRAELLYVLTGRL